MGFLIYHVLLWSGMRGEKGGTWEQPAKTSVNKSATTEHFCIHTSLMACHWSAYVLGLVLLLLKTVPLNRAQQPTTNG